MISVYLGAENIALNQAQKDAFRETLRAIGPAAHPSPAELMHWRSRADGDAVIMRALFNESDLTTNGLRALLATVLAVPVAQITAATSTQTYKTIPSTIVLMSLNAVQQMRFIIFGGGRASAQQSNDETIAYLKLNAAAWSDG